MQGLAHLTRHLTRELPCPRGRQRHQRCHDFAAAGSLAKLAERLQNRIKRLSAPIALDTMPFGNPRILRSGPLGGNELPEQRCLADARFTCNHHDLSVSASGLVHCGTQLPQFARASGKAAEALLAYGWRKFRCRDLDRRDETIAASAQRFDVARALRAIAEPCPDRLYVALHD